MCGSACRQWRRRPNVVSLGKRQVRPMPTRALDTPVWPKEQPDVNGTIVRSTCGMGEANSEHMTTPTSEGRPEAIQWRLTPPWLNEESWQPWPHFPTRPPPNSARQRIALPPTAASDKAPQLWCDTPCSEDRSAARGARAEAASSRQTRSCKVLRNLARGGRHPIRRTSTENGDAGQEAP